MTDGFQIKIDSSGHSFQAELNETVLEAALRQGINLPYSCQSGACQQCVADLKEGTAEVKGEMIGAGSPMLTCQAMPRSDLNLAVTVVSELQGVEVKTLPAKVDSIERVSDDVIILTLRFSPRESFSFLPGQFIDILHNGLRRSYSLANTHTRSKKLELHIREVEGGAFTGHVFNQMKTDDLLRFEGPMGSFFIRQGYNPIVFLAGGTGFAPVQSMVGGLLAKGDQRKLFIYWGGETPDSLYSKVPAQWQRSHSHIQYIPVISGDVVDRDWNGRRGFVHQAVLEDFPSLAGVDVYACGSPAMIEAAERDFKKAGLAGSAFFADAFVASN